MVKWPLQCSLDMFSLVTLAWREGAQKTSGVRCYVDG